MSTTAIPAHIWQQDATVWKAWILSLDAMPKAIQQNKRAIVNFYDTTNKPINEIIEQDISDYAAILQASGKTEGTVRRYIAPIKAYWKFAQKQTA